MPKSNWIRVQLYLHRPVSARERKNIYRYMKLEEKETKILHGDWHNFSKTFRPWNKKKGEQWIDKGYSLMLKVEKWLKKHPRCYQISCDDNAFASSMLVFVPHYTPRGWMGITVVFIPQCTGEDPTPFFLYPSHAKNFAEMLQMFSKLMKCRGKAYPPSPKLDS